LLKGIVLLPGLPGTVGDLYVGLFNNTDALREVLVDFVLPVLKANATASNLWMNNHFWIRYEKVCTVFTR